MNWMVYLDCLLDRISDLELLTEESKGCVSLFLYFLILLPKKM